MEKLHILSLDSLEIEDKTEPEIKEAFLRGIAFNSVMILHHGFFNVMKVSDKVQAATDYLSKMITFENDVKEDMTALWKEGGDNEEKSWIGFMVYKYLTSYDIPDEVAIKVGNKIVELPYEEPTKDELELLEKVLDNLVGNDPRYDLRTVFCIKNNTLVN